MIQVVTSSINKIGGSGLTPVLPPTTQATNLNVTNVAQSTIALNWTRGNGAFILIVVKQGSAVDSFPLDNNGYTANASFGSGSHLGGGN